jgi:hypothetical protein
MTALSLFVFLQSAESPCAGRCGALRPPVALYPGRREESLPPRPFPLYVLSARCGTPRRGVPPARAGLIAAFSFPRTYPSIRLAGISTTLARRYSPRVLAWGSMRTEAAAPSPRMPRMTKLTAFRFGKV